MTAKKINLLLMRHGSSDFNVISELYSNKFVGGPIFYRNGKNNLFKDSALSVLGKLQVNEMSKYINKFPVKYMFVSPLRRCLESSYYLYKDVPEDKWPKEICVLPDLRELILSINDVPSYWTKAQQSPNYEKYNFDMINPYLEDEKWFYKTCNTYKELHKLEDMCNELFKLDYVKHKAKTDLRFFNLLIKEENPYSIEPEEEVIKRVNSLKSFLNKFIEDKKEQGEVVNHNEILIVSHFNLLSYFVGHEKVKNISQISLLAPASAFSFEFEIN